MSDIHGRHALSYRSAYDDLLHTMPGHLLHSPYCQLLMHDDLPALSFYPGRFGDAPMQCDFSVLVTLQAAFANLSHARTDATTSS